mgnify:CR=1 FL=1
MPELNFTPEQRAAIDTRGSTVLVSAAAGSGKTRVLTERLMVYLTDAEHPVDIDHFLVITYTRAAAAELRSRILDGIYARIASDPENRRLRRQVALCARAEIGTIHSFCADFLRANCAALALAPDFQVADTERCAALRAAALEHTLERAYTRLDTDAPFRLLADTVGGGRDDARLGELVLSLYDKMQCHARPEQWAQRQVDLLALDGVTDAGATPWGQALLARVRESAVHWAGVLDKQLDIMAAQDMAWLYGIYGTSFAETADGLRAVVRACDQSWDAAVAALQNVPFPRLGSTRKPPDPDVRDRVKAQRDAAKKAIQALQKQINVPSAQALADLHTTAPAMQALLALTLDFGAAYAAEKRRRSLVDFSDLEHMTAQLLTDDDGAPTELARQLSGRYTEIMVDEYQDVSEVQDLIFRAVSRDGNNLFFVGDVKQSIYRFRLADPTIFLSKYDAYPPLGTQAPGEPRKLLLSQNFRSRAEILEAANDVFSLVMKKEAGELDYTQDEALVPGAQFPDSPGPKVELHCLNYLASEEESGDKTGAEAEFVAARIERLLREASVTEDGALRPARPSDIVILMRSPGMIAGVYQAALQRRGIACDVGGDGDLMQTAEIEILFQLLQIIDNPHRDIPLAAAMASPVFGFTPEELALLRAQAQKADLYDCLCACREPSEKLCAFLSWLSRMREESRRTPLPELLNTVVQSSGLEMVFAALPDGERRRGSLAAFASFVTAGAQTELRSLSELVQLLLQMQQRGARLPAQDAPARSDAVRIMSIHKSKGLEFPIVILADLARKMNMQDNAAAVLTDEELLIGGNVVDLASRSYYHGLARRAIIDRKTAQTVSEELRVLYVAMTRAKEQLIMTSCAAHYGSRLKKLLLRLSDPLGPWVSAAVRQPDEWILLAALCRTESGALFAECGPCAYSRVRQYPWLVTLQDVSPAAPAARGAQAEAPRAAQPLDREQVLESVGFRYAHEAATRLPSKLTATQLKGRGLDLEAAEETPAQPESARKPWRTPQFLQDRPLTGREKGNATHLFMQFVHYEACTTRGGIQQELARLQTEKFLTARQAEAVDAEKILALFSSELGKRILNAKNLRREFKFSILTDAGAYDPAAAGEQVMLQGVVDCFWQEADGIVILDFKTDYIDGDLQLKAARYAPQLQAYARALSLIYGLSVRKCILYFFSAGKAVEIDPE